MTINKYLYESIGPDYKTQLLKLQFVHVLKRCNTKVTQLWQSKRSSVHSSSWSEPEVILNDYSFHGISSISKIILRLDCQNSERRVYLSLIGNCRQMRNNSCWSHINKTSYRNVAMTAKTTFWSCCTKPVRPFTRSFTS